MSPSRKPRVAADVAVALLEVIKQQDHPLEVLEDEDVSRTMPRRLGLSEVVDRQIRLHRENARRGRKLTDAELAELMRLVIKRPDSPEIFFEVGATLARGDGGGMVRSLPRPFKLFLVKRRVQRRLRKLFGRRVGGFISGPFSLEGSASPFVQADPGGDACHLVSGFCQQALREVMDGEPLVVEQACETRGDPSCRWTMVEATADSPVEAIAPIG